MGWKLDVRVDHPDKFVIALAPHEHRDFVLGEVGVKYAFIRMKINFLMKKEWFFWPLVSFFRHMGGIPRHRSKHTSMTDAIAHS